MAKRRSDLRETIVQVFFYVRGYPKCVGINMSEHFFGLRHVHLITQRHYGVPNGCGASGGISGTDFRQGVGELAIQLVNRAVESFNHIFDAGDHLRSFIGQPFADGRIQPAYIGGDVAARLVP